MKKGSGGDIVNVLDFLKTKTSRLESVVKQLVTDTRALKEALDARAIASANADLSRMAENSGAIGISQNRDPPKSGEFLLIAFATTRHVEAQIGDLNEHFANECEKLGRRRAV